MHCTAPQGCTEAAAALLTAESPTEPSLRRPTAAGYYPWRNLLQALGLSWLYYYAQRSGKLSNVYNPIPWRGDSHVNDSVVGAPHGEDSPLLHLVSLH